MSCTALSCCNDSPFAYSVTARTLKYRVWVEALPTYGGTVSWSSAGAVRGDSTEAIVPAGTPVTVTAVTSTNVVNLDVGADVLLAIDESASMGPLSWLTSMLTQLDADLLAAGIGTDTVTNRYALMGFGLSSAAHAGKTFCVLPTYHGGAHKHYVTGTAAWGTAAQAITAIANFNRGTSNPGGAPGYEDAYEALRCAIYDYIAADAWRADVAKVVVFITDEERNAMVFQTGTTPAGQTTAIRNAAAAAGLTLVGVIAQACLHNADAALGIDTDGNAWTDDGDGTFTKHTSGGTTTGGTTSVQNPLASGTVTSADATHLTDSTKSWTINEWVGRDCRILTGADALQNLAIISNTSNTLEVSGWATIPSATDQYQISYEAASNIDYQLTGGIKGEYTDLVLDPLIDGAVFYDMPFVDALYTTLTAPTVVATVGNTFVAAVASTTGMTVAYPSISIGDRSFTLISVDGPLQITLRNDTAAFNGITIASGAVSFQNATKTNARTAATAALVDYLADKIKQTVSWIWGGWYHDATLMSSSLAYTFTPTSDITLTAHFDSITD